MPTQTYTLIAQTTLAAATSTVTFGSLPQTYRDLVLVMTVSQNTTSARQGAIYPNNDSGNASLVYMDGYGSGPGGGTGSTIVSYFVSNGQSANILTTSITHIMDYSATDKHKTFLTRAGNSAEPVSAYASRWASTSAITSLVLPVIQGTSYNANSTFALYGIAS